MTTRLPTAAPQPEQIQRRAIILLSSIVVLLLLAIVFVSLRAGAGHHPQAPATAAQGATAPDTVVPAPPLASDAEPQLPLVSLDTTEHIAQKVELPPVPELEIAPAAYLAEPPAAVEPAVLALAAPPAMQIKSRRYATEKFGVVELQVTIPADLKWEYRPDWACRVSSADQRVFYPAYQLELADDGQHAKPPTAAVRGTLRRVSASFLTYGQQPLRIDLNYGGQPLLTQQEIPTDAEEADQPAMLDAWWASYTQPPREPLNNDARLLKSYLHEMLARRLNRPAARQLSSLPDERSMLQRQFERSIGSFLGFDSVKVALGDQDRFQRRRVEALSQPLPTPPQIPAVQFPPTTSTVAIESIAAHVPDDCVYLRCQSLANYLWFRDLLLGWGGSLDEVVSPRQRDSQIRERLERQLAFAPDAEAQAVLKTAISDLALVFGDTCFADGAAVGVLFQAKNETQLPSLLKKQRDRALHDFADSGASEQLLSIAGRRVSFLTTSDGRLRSYHAISGQYHFVSNSAYLVRRFFEAGQGQRSLHNLKEFKYARTKVRLHKAQDIFLYMPDPFFHRIISPRHQIEVARRQQAKEDIRHVELARLAARNEGLQAKRVQHLVDGGFLPPEFGPRSDGTYTVLKTAAEDSARGLPGTFVPIADMEIERTTPHEVTDYWNFSQRYRNQYRMMDPVAVVASHRPTKNGNQEVDIEITITPYALQTYAVARAVLAPPRQAKIVGPPGEILSLQGSLRTYTGDAFLAAAAIHDTELQFKLVDGELRVDGHGLGDSFAGRNWQLVFDRQDPNCLQSVLALIGDVGGSSTAANSIVVIETLIGGYLRFLALITGVPINPQPGLQPAQPAGGPGWDVRSPREDLRKADFKKVATSEKHQVRLELNQLQGTKVEPYIQAHTWLAARLASTRQAALAELTMQQFGLPAAEVLPALERIHAAKILCPLDGQLSSAEGQWRSSRWTTSSLYDETEIPADYRFAFTDWLRGLNVGFSLEGQTLSADLQLEVQPRPAK